MYYGFLSLINCTFDDSGTMVIISGLTPGKNDIAMWTGDPTTVSTKSESKVTIVECMVPPTATLSNKCAAQRGRPSAT